MARPIADVVATDRNARLFRAINKYGMHLADFAAISTTSRFDAFGNGTGYTVGNWISDGIFGNLGAVQAVYPIVQSTDDHVDWVLLQSAIDFMLFGAMDSAARGAMKSKLIIPAGHFLINRPLHIGYGAMGTPPPTLNSNRYVSITIEGEGPQFDPAQSGMPGTTIFTEAYTYPGIVVSRPQQVLFKDFSLVGPFDAWMQVNTPYRAINGHDRSAYRPAGVADANWVGGAAVNIGIGLDLYSNSTAAAAYPARVLPSYYGGGTTTATSGDVSGTDLSCDNVNVRGFFIGVGRPHGDNNGEFVRYNKGVIANCVQSFVIGHSQARNCSITHTNIGGFHTAISSRGGLTGNSNMHGTYENIHLAQGYQLVDHPQADWSGPMTLRDCYAESFLRIGNWAGTLKLDNCQLSFIEQEDIVGSAYSHCNVQHLILDNCRMTMRHGLMTQGWGDNAGRVDMVNGTNISVGLSSNYGDLATGEQEKVFNGQQYMQYLFTEPGFNNRRVSSTGEIMQGGYGNKQLFYDERANLTFLDQQWTQFASEFPRGSDPYGISSPEMQGSVQQFPVPKITKWQINVNITSRSGRDIVCDRTSQGDIKADVGDVFAFQPAGVDDNYRIPTWFIVVSVTTSTMTLRQLHNYWQTSRYDYTVSGWPFYQMGVGGGNLAQYICTRVRQSTRLFVGNVTDGSNVITNIRSAFRHGTTDDFTAFNFNAPYGSTDGMAVGDYFLHQEIERANTTGGTGLKVHNRVSAIDFTANTITLTENFNITRTNYPIAFYVKTFTA